MTHALIALICICSGEFAFAAETSVEWSGRGMHRILVRVEPLEIGGRASDEMPADLPIDFAAELGKLAAASSTDAGHADIASIQVIRYDPRTGHPIPHNDYAYAAGEADRPFAWYDASIPCEFPEFSDSVDRTNGRIVRKPQTRGGYLYNAVGDGDRGRLAWTHTQTGSEPSYYAIYFSVVPAGQVPHEAPPRGWLGDGMPRYDRVGTSSCGADHCRVDVDDWDGDGLVDLIVGEAYGHVFLWQNRGTREKPEFLSCRYVFDAEGLPIDAGNAAAPKVVDWDGDGAKDLLVGAEWNRILFYRNAGTNADRKLDYQGLLQADGQTLALPVTPVAEGSADIFKRDYYPVLETVDWDSDGDVDLLAGGYITGRMYIYENTGRGADGLPALMLRGPVEDGQGPINVGDWCAAPCAADFDGDGDLDLFSGNMPMGDDSSRHAQGGDWLLRYWENIGDAKRPKFASRPFPKDQGFPHGALATPRAADWDGDGDLDLVVSARESIFLFENVGSSAAPRFATSVSPLPAPWGQAPVNVDQFRDWNGDGKLDLIAGYTVWLNSGKGNPWSWETRESVLPPGEYIEHSSGIGDDWFWPFIDDFDGDGRLDVLFGDWHGHVWLHRNLSTPEKAHFDTMGAPLHLRSGGEIKVGPINKDVDKDFDALQGARTVFAPADFDRDGRRDLVVGDTYGIIRYFKNVGSPADPLFNEPVQIGDLGIRLLVTATDWNGDGWTDVIGGAANGRVRVYLNNAGKGEQPFAEGFDPKLPPIPQPRVLVADLNGDGDDDLFLPSTQGSCLVERSFLLHGYAPAVLLSVEEW